MQMAARFWQALGTALIFLVVANIGLHALFIWRYPGPQAHSAIYSEFSEERRASYAGMTAQDVDELLAETWTRPGYVYEPETGFHEVPRTTRFVNVSADGIRYTAGAENDLSKVDFKRTLLLFGGSTTFGYGVTDGQTITSHLQREFPQHNFINLGRAYYYSAQEDIFLLRLLRAGYNIRYAAFLDGINERCDLLTYQAEMARLFAQAQSSQFSYSWDWRHQIIHPLLWLTARMRAKFGRAAVPPRWMYSLDCQSYGRTLRLHEVVAQNLRARTSLCHGFGIACVTFAQPFPGIQALHLDLQSLPDFARLQLRSKYEELKPMWDTAGAVDISDALADFDKHAFVDNVHYSDDANAVIARHMLIELRARFGWQ
jgi:hypothetical protein